MTAIASGLALILWCAWLVLVFTAYATDPVLTASTKTTVLALGLTAVLVSLGLGLVFNRWVDKTFAADAGFSHWKEHSEYNYNCYRIVVVISALTVPLFRILYSRFFNRANFSCYFIEGAELLRISNYFTFAFILFCILPLIFVCGYIIYIKQTYDQTLIYGIDVLLLSLALLLFLFIDMASKGSDYFNRMIEDQPYLKRLKYNNLEQSASCIRFLGEDDKAGYHS